MVYLGSRSPKNRLRGPESVLRNQPNFIPDAGALLGESCHPIDLLAIADSDRFYNGA